MNLAKRFFSNKSGMIFVTALLMASLMVGCAATKWHGYYNAAVVHNQNITILKNTLADPEVNWERKTYLRRHVTPYMNLLSYSYKTIAAHEQEDWTTFGTCLDEIRKIGEKVDWNHHPLWLALQAEPLNWETFKREIDRLTYLTKGLQKQGGL